MANRVLAPPTIMPPPNPAAVSRPVEPLTPGSILGLVLQESIFITGIAGYVGLVLGVLVLEAAAKGISGAEMFHNPEVDLGIAAAATVLLVLAGTVAGFIPARRAAAVRPIEALRDE